MISSDVWDDQGEFNEQLRTPPHLAGEPAVAAFIKDRMLDLMSECHELLSTTGWKTHRRQTRRQLPNRDHRLEEAIDIFKLWLTVVQGCGYSQEEIRQAYWRKSMVVRQRYSEEWLKTLDRAAVVIDIDNVLCDYTTGFCNWVINRAPLFAKRAEQIRDRRQWFGKAEDFGMTEVEWQGFKHEFRSHGHKRQLPAMPGAHAFLKRVREAGFLVILLTSRPIDRYPNLYADTVYWLHDQQLSYDWLWWATDKGERLVEGNALKHVKLVVDDDPRYVAQFKRLGLPVVWLQSTYFATATTSLPFAADDIPVVKALQYIQLPLLTGATHAGLR